MNRHSRWWWLTHVLFGAFALTVLVLLVLQAREIAWAEVGRAMLQAPHQVLLASLLLTALSYLLYAALDLLAKPYVGHRVPWPTTTAIGVISYAFNLNIGALVGSAGFRLRLYSRLGVRPAAIARIIGLAIAGNWSGYVLLGGVLLAWQRLAVPPEWSLGADALQWLGWAMLAATVAYPLLCALFPNRSWTIRGHDIELPSLSIALAQMATSTANWLVIATILWLLVGDAGYGAVLGVVLLSAVAGAIAHIPAGLGVMEAVFVMTLPGAIGTHRILAALMIYRGVYYLLPLLLSIALYIWLERRARPGTRAAATG